MASTSSPPCDAAPIPSDTEAEAARRLLERSVPIGILDDWRVLQDLLVRSLEGSSALLAPVPEIRSAALRRALGRFPSYFRAAQAWRRWAMATWSGFVGLALAGWAFLAPGDRPPYLVLCGVLGVVLTIFTTGVLKDLDVLVSLTHDSPRPQTGRLGVWLVRRAAHAFWDDLARVSPWWHLGWNLVGSDPPALSDVMPIAGVAFDRSALPLLGAAQLAGRRDAGEWAEDLWRLAVEGAAVDRARGDFLGGRPSGLHGVPLPLRGGMHGAVRTTLPAKDGHGLTASLRRLASTLRTAPPSDVRGMAERSTCAPAESPTGRDSLSHGVPT